MLRRLATIAAGLTLAACSDGFSPTGVTGSKNVVTVPLTFDDSTTVPQAGSPNCHGMEPFLSPEKLAKIPGCRS